VHPTKSTKSLGNGVMLPANLQVFLLYFVCTYGSSDLMITVIAQLQTVILHKIWGLEFKEEQTTASSHLVSKPNSSLSSYSQELKQIVFLLEERVLTSQGVWILCQAQQQNPIVKIGSSQIPRPPSHQLWRLTIYVPPPNPPLPTLDHGMSLWPTPFVMVVTWDLQSICLYFTH
jgi:hypothetical protein